MELAELIGNDGELANVAIKWVESTLNHPGVCTCDSTLDSMGHEDKIRLVRGLCGLLIMWSYSGHGGEPYSSGKNWFVLSIKEGVDREVNANRDGLYARYLAASILTASTRDEQEFYRQLQFLEPDTNGSLVLRKRTIERVIQQFVSWFRYYTWNWIWRGYGQSGQDNVQSALDHLKVDMVNIIEKDKQARDIIVEPAAPAVAYESLSAYFDRNSPKTKNRQKNGYLAIIKRTIKKEKRAGRQH